MITHPDNSNRREALPGAAAVAAGPAGLRATSRRSGGRFVQVWGTLTGPKPGSTGELLGFRRVNVKGAL
jgi:hypothetical protein